MVPSERLEMELEKISFRGDMFIFMVAAKRKKKKIHLSVHKSQKMLVNMLKG